MSQAAKLTLLGTSLGAVGIIVFVHYAQRADKAVCINFLAWESEYTDVLQAMHAGVLRDMENQRLKRERQADFEIQAKLEAEYRKLQTVRDDPVLKRGGS